MAGSPLDKKLVLNQYLISLFEVEDFAALVSDMKSPQLEGYGTGNESRFYLHLVNSERTILSEDLLRQYDENIVRHTVRISHRRDKMIHWKYFQYISLLFTEIYLDLYFNERNQLLEELNSFVEAFNSNKVKQDQVDLYSEADLNKIAFWNATGSGKTLIMHVNILQYLHYFQKHPRMRELNRVILLTPSEGLSRQHLREFQTSGLRAALFDKNQGSLFQDQGEITIIDIHKLKDEPGETTVAVDSFESNNLVLVDEGHRGSSGHEWKTRREQLSHDGFAFEYSATFGQAVSGRRDLEQEYAKAIIFDYSYRFFHSDGYGKDYQILNLRDDSKEEVRYLYLLACLVSFYQQVRLYTDREVAFHPFNIEKPLWVFVGGSVNAVRTQQGRKVSDVVDILLFIHQFIEDDSRSIRLIKSLLSGKPGLLDDNGREIFRNSFPYLIALKMEPDEIYRDIVLKVFNSPSTGTTLRAYDLKGVDGEIALQLGESEPFGIINVGDTRELIKLCEKCPELVVSEKDFSDSYFHNLGNKHSCINMLIGSRRFTEGWDSWRVSTMGIMNIGRSEGSQIIQLFGRGVRLKGYDLGLKRSEFLGDEVDDIPEYLPILETLNVFGVRADYMQEFKEVLEEGGVSSEPQSYQVVLPVIPNFSRTNPRLKTLRLPEGLDFKRHGPRPRLLSRDLRTYVVLNWYPRLQRVDSRKKAFAEINSSELNRGVLDHQHLAFMDLDRIFFEMQRFKREKAWHNLSLSKEDIRKLLLRGDWYTLFIPARDLEFTSFRKVKMWQEIAIILLRKYCEQQYYDAKSEWEAPQLQYYDLEETDSNFVKEYRVSAPVSDEAFLAWLRGTAETLAKGEITDCEFGSFSLLRLCSHLYNPLISLGKGGEIRVSPVPLNSGEHRFLLDLRSYYMQRKSWFEDKELYLLRNQSRGRGVGFFEAGGFYPDFILWILYDGRQYITFIDPKGIRHHSLTKGKYEFYRSIKNLEARLGNPNIALNSFIVSNTYYRDLIETGEIMSKQEMIDRNLLFQEDRETYVSAMFAKILR